MATRHRAVISLLVKTLIFPVRTLVAETNSLIAEPCLDELDEFAQRVVVERIKLIWRQETRDDLEQLQLPTGQ
jgi:hypothetical protein